jgi:DNA polymerase-3 subunit epsilon
MDAEILADVYLAMTGGQTTFQLADNAGAGDSDGSSVAELRRVVSGRMPLPIISAGEQELAQHEIQLQAIAAKSGGKVLWRDLLES